MAKTYTAVGVHESARFITSAVIILGLAWTVGKPHAENLINQTVETKLKNLEAAVDQAASSNRSTGAQLAAQQEALKGVQDDNREIKGDIKDIERSISDLKTILLDQARR